VETHKSFEPEVVLDHTERALVAHAVATNGFPIIHRLIRSEVDKFIVGLINTGVENEAAIVANHRLAKAAAQVYTAFMNRINFEVEAFRAAVAKVGDPVDVTEGTIDLGAPASTQSDLDDDLSNEFEIIEEDE